MLSSTYPGKNTGVGCHSLLQGIFLTQGLNRHRLHWQVVSLLLSHQESPRNENKPQKLMIIGDIEEKHINGVKENKRKQNQNRMQGGKLETMNALVCSGCSLKIPQTRWLPQQKLRFSGSEVTSQGQSLNNEVYGESFPLALQTATPLLCLHVAFPWYVRAPAWEGSWREGKRKLSGDSSKNIDCIQLGLLFYNPTQP